MMEDACKFAMFVPTVERVFVPRCQEFAPRPEGQLMLEQ